MIKTVENPEYSRFCDKANRRGKVRGGFRLLRAVCAGMGRHIP
jgi:hypothetical protein